MKVLLYFENERALRMSGIGRALEHQKRALELNNIEYTTNPKDSFDIAHINTYYLGSLRLLKKCKKKGIPVIVHGHSTKEDFRNSFRFWTLAKPFVYKMMKDVYSRADLIITPTKYSKGLIEGYDYIKCPVADVSNGININRYNKPLNEGSIKYLQEKYNIKPGMKLVIGIGWTFKRKGTDDFIEIAKHMPDTKFIWFGNHKALSNTHYINKVIKERSENCLFPGYVKQDEIIDMLHMADCFLFPSHEETEGIVVLEALACKTPVVARNIGALSYLENEADAYLGDDINMMEAYLKKVLESDNTKLIEAGYKKAQERDLVNIGRKLEYYYTSMLKK